MTEISFEDLTANVGSAVHGLDMRGPLSDETRDRLDLELADRSVLLIRDQNDLSPEQHVAFSRRFGPLEAHVLQNFCLPDYPEIFVVSNIVENGKHVGAYGGSKEYHSDLAYIPEPSMGSVFHCLECPEEGGETSIVSMSAVYEALPQARREWLAGQRAVFDYVWQYERAHHDRPTLTEAQKARVPPVGHPAVRTHPVNGKPALFLSEIWVRRFEGIDDAESQETIREILDFAMQPEFTYVHTWQPGDVIIWDNRNSMHKACPFDEANTRRRMHRTTIKGTAPFYESAA